MTYIIAEPCIDIKDLSCVDVCPVDCIHEFERILIIDPEECIDCFAGDEQLFTSYGLRSFAELENQAVRVLTDDGFRPAVVKRFRRKPLVKLELAPAFEERDRYGGTRLTTRNISKFRRSIWATPTHSWFLADGERTDSLAPGQFVPSARFQPRSSRARGTRRASTPCRCRSRARVPARAAGAATRRRGSGTAGAGSARR